MALSAGIGVAPSVRVGSVEVDGVSAPTWETGPVDSTEAVVFVHGLPGSGKEFTHLQPPLGNLIRTLSFDIPGFGQADKPADFEYTSQGLSKFIGAVVRVCGIERAHLVTHDFGGGWAFEWAVNNADSVASVVSMNIGLVGLRMHWLPRVWRNPLLGPLAQAVAQLRVTRVLLWHGNPRGLPRSFVDGMYEHYDRGTKRAVLQMYRETEQPQQMLERLARDLAPLDLPSLVIWGAHDPYIPLRCAERVRLLFPASEFSYYEDSGHWPFVDNPGRTSRELVEFVRAQISDRGSAR